MFLKQEYNICFKEHQIPAEQLSADRSSTGTLYCLISVTWQPTHVVFL